MWEMNDEIRVLTNEEWALFAAGLEDLGESVKEDIWFHERETKTGVPVFDELAAGQQIALLSDVASALRDPTITTPVHTLATDGAIAAVFATVRELLSSELNDEADNGEETFVRSLIRGVYRNSRDRSRRLPPATRKSPDAWEVLLEEIEARMHWERGYGQGVYDPVEALPLSERDSEYYREVPRAPDETGVIVARQVLARLMGLPVPDHTGLFPALFDFYHDIVIGPLPPEMAEKWDDRPWARIGWRTFPDWDCDHPTWLKELRPAVPDVPFTVLPTMPVRPTQKRGRGRPTTPQAPSLPHNVRSVQRHSEWVLCNEYGYWCDLLYSVWGEEENALRFPSENEAICAYVQAGQMHEERATRCRAVRARLGLPEPDWS